MERHVVALGGGGFTTGDDNALDDFVLRLTGRARPHVCFLATAQGDSPSYVVDFYDSFRERAEPAHLELFGRPRRDIRDFLLAQDAIYVGGGNTANMLAVWRVHGVDEVLREGWERGVVLAGMSAGSICWFEAGVTDSFGDELAPLRCLGFLPGSNCPHYDSEAERRPTYLRLVGSGELPAGFAADDGVGLHFAGDELAEVVSARPDAQAYRVERAERGAVETPITVRRLG
jgi:dipeptidase E